MRTTIPGLILAQHPDLSNVDICYVKGSSGYRALTLIKVKGVVYSLNFEVDLSRKFRIAKRQLQAYCKFAGVNFVDLMIAIDKQQRIDAEEERKEDIELLTRQAATLGYKLTKIRKPK